MHTDTNSQTQPGYGKQPMKFYLKFSMISSFTNTACVQMCVGGCFFVLVWKL